jgi:hypothetical protein
MKSVLKESFVVMVSWWLLNNILKDACFSNHCEFNCLTSIIAIPTSNHAMYKCQCKSKWTLALYQVSHNINQKFDQSYACFLFKAKSYLYSMLM